MPGSPLYGYVVSVTDRKTVVVNIGEQKRKRTIRKRKPAPPPQPKVIQQFIPQFTPSFDMGGVQRLIQSEIRMLEPPRLNRLEDIEREREEMRRERLILGEQQEQAQQQQQFLQMQLSNPNLQFNGGM